MAYDPAALSVGFQLIGGKYNVWVYQSTDPFSTVDDTDYFSNATAAGMAVGDIVFAVDTDTGPTITLAYVSAIDADGNGTVLALATAGAPTFTAASMATLTVTTEAYVGTAGAAALIGFHGVPAVDQAALITLETTVSASVIASRVKSILALLTEKGLMASA